MSNKSLTRILYTLNDFCLLMDEIHHDIPTTLNCELGRSVDTMLNDLTRVIDPPWGMKVAERQCICGQHQ